MKTERAAGQRPALPKRQSKARCAAGRPTRPRRRNEKGADPKGSALSVVPAAGRQLRDEDPTGSRPAAGSTETAVKGQMCGWQANAAPAAKKKGRIREDPPFGSAGRWPATARWKSVWQSASGRLYRNSSQRPDVRLAGQRGPDGEMKKGRVRKDPPLSVVPAAGRQLRDEDPTGSRPAAGSTATAVSCSSSRPSLRPARP